MTQEAINQARALYKITSDKEEIEALHGVYHCEASLQKVLENPTISMTKKMAILDRIAEQAKLSQLMKNFLKELCRNDVIDLFDEIVEAFEALWDEAHHIVRAEISFAKEPKQEEIQRINDFLKKEYPKKEIKATVQICPELLGGVRICVGHKEYDWSYNGCLKQLELKFA